MDPERLNQFAVDSHGDKAELTFLDSEAHRGEEFNSWNAQLK
jgi:hypothetical protein